MERATQQSGLIDTDILIDSSRGMSAAGSFLDDRQSGDGISISIISAMELLGGCRSKAQLADVREFIRQAKVLPLTIKVSRRAMSLMEEFTLSHHLMLPDALIAATCLEANLPLFTRNVRHFNVIQGLEVVRPY